MCAKKHTRSILSEPVVMAGNHEPLIFRRRTGSAAADETGRFDYEHSEDLVKRLAARGVNWVRTHFFKGFGLEAERAEIEMTREFVALCHRHGIRVELYTQFGTLQYETFLVEAPDMRDWCAVNADGKHTSITYGHQDFRYKPCLVREGYWTYFRRVLETGIDHVKGDAFGFDNVGNASEPESCHCDACRAAFVAFLKKKYRVDTKAGRALATERFGFDVLDHVEPPRFNRWNPMVGYRVLRNPVIQEWLEFKCDNLARRFEEIWRFVKERKPDMLLEYNVYGDFGCNTAWFDGVDMHRLLPWGEAFWNERAPHAPGFTRDGRFLHRVHPYKLAQASDAVVFDWHAGKTPAQRELSLAEGLAFNSGHLSGFGYMLDFAAGGFPELDAFLAFRKSHDDLFADAAGAAQVALLEASRTLNYDCITPHYTLVLAMGSLLAGHVPFEMSLDPDGDALKRYDVVVLPNVQSVRDDEARMVMDYVSAGGGVVVTDETSLYDGWRRRRSEGALREMMPEVKAFDAGRKGTDARAVRGTFGKGRFVYLPRLQPVKEFEDRLERWEIHLDLWHLPVNFKQFIDAVRWAAADALRVTVSAPTGLAAELRRTPDGRHVLHLLNYRLDKPASNVSVAVRALDVNEARLWTCPKTQSKKLKCTRSRDTVKVAVGTVRRYAIVELA